MRAIELMLQSNGLNKIIELTRNGILVDTGILELFFIGLYDKRKNTRFLNNFNYTSRDYDILIKFFDLIKIRHDKFVITPNVFAEFSYWVKENIKESELEEFIRAILDFIKAVQEDYVNKNKIIESEEFKLYDSADVSLTIKLNDYSSIFTDDSPFANHCEKKSGEKLIIHFKEDIVTFYNTIAR